MDKSDELHRAFHAPKLHIISHLKGLGVEDKQSAGDVGKGVLEGQGQSQAEYAQQSDKGCGRNAQLPHDHGK